MRRHHVSRPTSAVRGAAAVARARKRDKNFVGATASFDSADFGLEEEEERVRAEAEARRPPTEEQEAKRSGRRGDDQLTLSLLLPFGEGGLPPKGKTRFQKEEECDPWTQNCKTEAHVWESKCPKCFGTGTVIAGSRGHRTRRRARRYGAGGASFSSLSTCPKCLGTGYVRHSSARTIPSPFPNGSSAGDTNVAAARGSMTFESGDFDENK